MFDYITSRVLQEEKLRQTRQWESRSERSVPSWLRSGYQTIALLLSTYMPGARTKREKTA